MNLETLLESFESNSFDKQEINKFKLSEDGQSAEVVMLISDEAELMKYIRETHKLTFGKYPNTFSCLGEDCPACKAGVKKGLTLQLPVYNVSAGRVELWERGLGFIKGMAEYLETYGDLRECNFKIARSGKKGDTNTTYNVLYVPRKKTFDVDLSALVIPAIEGTDYKQILKVSSEQMTEVIEQGTLTWSKSASSSTTTTDEEVPF